MINCVIKLLISSFYSKYIYQRMTWKPIRIFNYWELSDKWWFKTPINDEERRDYVDISGLQRPIKDHHFSTSLCFRHCLTRAWHTPSLSLTFILHFPFLSEKNRGKWRFLFCIQQSKSYHLVHIFYIYIHSLDTPETRGNVLKLVRIRQTWLLAATLLLFHIFHP